MHSSLRNVLRAFFSTAKGTARLARNEQILRALGEETGVLFIGADGARSPDIVPVTSLFVPGFFDRQLKDLVLVAPNASPPVVRLVDRRKVLERAETQAAAALAQRRRCREKELCFSTCMAPGDFNVRYKRACALLNDSFRVRIVIEPRGSTRRVPAAREEMMRAVMDRLVAEYGARLLIICPPQPVGPGILAVTVSLSSENQAK